MKEAITTWKYIMEDRELQRRITELSLEHKDIDDALNLMRDQSFIDELQLRRMKKRKLKLKDEITILKSKLIPDIDA